MLEKCFIPARVRGLPSQPFFFFFVIYISRRAHGEKQRFAYIPTTDRINPYIAANRPQTPSISHLFTLSPLCIPPRAPFNHPNTCGHSTQRAARANLPEERVKFAASWGGGGKETKRELRGRAASLSRNSPGICLGALPLHPDRARAPHRQSSASILLYIPAAGGCMWVKPPAGRASQIKVSIFFPPFFRLLILLGSSVLWCGGWVVCVCVYTKGDELFREIKGATASGLLHSLCGSLIMPRYVFGLSMRAHVQTRQTEYTMRADG